MRIEKKDLLINLFSINTDENGVTVSTRSSSSTTNLFVFSERKKGKLFICYQGPNQLHGQTSSIFGTKPSFSQSLEDFKNDLMPYVT